MSVEMERLMRSFWKAGPRYISRCILECWSKRTLDGEKALETRSRRSFPSQHPKKTDPLRVCSETLPNTRPKGDASSSKRDPIFEEEKKSVFFEKGLSFERDTRAPPRHVAVAQRKVRACAELGAPSKVEASASACADLSPTIYLSLTRKVSRNDSGLWRVQKIWSASVRAGVQSPLTR